MRSKCGIYLTAFCSREHGVGIAKATQQMKACARMATMATKTGLWTGPGGSIHSLWGRGLATFKERHLITKVDSSI